MSDAGVQIRIVLDDGMHKELLRVIEWWTRDQVALYAGMKPDSVRKWAARYSVRRNDQGLYHGKDVMEKRAAMPGVGWRAGQRGSHKERTGTDNGR